ncbi:hypothetical protein CFter6_2820 [Collimonas fungivorans]|uniref:Uncharacterized protein n=1 Tax=Collimonas fungivorans TaxID=158899 RepID=A0A127PCG3_9BURK|nr:hypothetical protein CFter6_2820 [Collimonas fungivorans]
MFDFPEKFLKKNRSPAIFVRKSGIQAPCSPDIRPASFARVNMASDARQHYCATICAAIKKETAT